MNISRCLVLLLGLSLLTLPACGSGSPSSTATASRTDIFYTTNHGEASLPWAEVGAAPGDAPEQPPAAPALSTGDAVAGSTVIVWADTGDFSTGIVAGDGETVIAPWNFEDWQTPGYFYVLAPGGGHYRAYIQAFDSRTALVRFSVQGLDLSPVTLGDTASPQNGQAVTARVFTSPQQYTEVPVLVNTFFSVSTVSFQIGYRDTPTSADQYAAYTVITPGSVIVDQDGAVIGLAGVNYDDDILASHPHPMYLSPPTPPVANTDAIRDILSPGAAEQYWANAPLQATLAGPLTNVVMTSPQFNGYETWAAALAKLEAELGATFDTTQYEARGVRGGYPANEGKTISVIYPFPVMLTSAGGEKLAAARWVAVQWDRQNGAPSRLFYGMNAATIDGGFIIQGDISALAGINAY